MKYCVCFSELRTIASVRLCYRRSSYKLSASSQGLVIASSALLSAAPLLLVFLFFLFFLVSDFELLELLQHLLQLKVFFFFFPLALNFFFNPLIVFLHICNPVSLLAQISILWRSCSRIRIVPNFRHDSVFNLFCISLV
jgi:hypothetical protein